MEKRFVKIAVNTFFIKENKLLLGKRRNGKSDGDWGLPGGHLEFGESLMEGMKRELIEEIGIIPEGLEIFQIVNNVTDDYGGHHYLHINFIAVGAFGEAKLMEPEKCYEWKWFDFDALPTDIFIGHKSSIEGFLNKETVVDRSMSGDITYIKLHN